MLFQLPDPESADRGVVHVLYSDDERAVCAVISRLSDEEDEAEAALVARETGDVIRRGLCYTSHVAVYAGRAAGPPRVFEILHGWHELHLGADVDLAMRGRFASSAASRTPLPDDDGAKAPLANCAPHHAGKVPELAHDVPLPGGMRVMLRRYRERDVRTSVQIAFDRAPDPGSCWGALVCAAHPRFLVRDGLAERPPGSEGAAEINGSGAEYWRRAEGSLPAGEGRRLAAEMMIPDERAAAFLEGDRAWEAESAFVGVEIDAQVFLGPS